MERHRALAQACEALLASGEGRRCLEIGPASPVVYGEFLRRRGWDYVAVDKWRTGNPVDPRAVGFIDQEADVADLAPIPDESFDVVIAQHVIEEVPEYREALAAIKRVLTPGGSALLEIPYDARREASERHEPRDYGNVWTFGLAMLGELATTFGSLELVPLVEGAYRGELMVCPRPAAG
jgi:SAM-dependent methyltransferase